MEYLRWGSIPTDVPLWGCAYQNNTSKESKALKKEPVFGIIKKEGNDYFFYEFKKNGEIKKSSRVYRSSRIYADTLEESIELYNDKVDSCIRELEKLVEDSKKDRIIKI